MRITFTILMLVVVRNDHNSNYRAEAFSLSRQHTERLASQQRSTFRESLISHQKHQQISSRYTHNSSRLSLSPRDSNKAEDDNDTEDSHPPSGTLEDARHRLGLNDQSHDEDEDDDFNDEDIEHISSENIEDARQRLEEMMSIPQESQHHEQRYNRPRIRIPSPRTIAHLKYQMNSEKVSQPPLTTALRQRRISELNLLNSLSTSDKAINELWSLWFTERGTEAASILLRAAGLSSRAFGASDKENSPSPELGEIIKSGDKDAQEAEALLWDLIEEYGVHWVEPLNQLATLMYLRGRLEESKALCEVVLSVKPWHIGALSGIVMVCMSMNDVVSAREWAEKRLPPLLYENDGRVSRRQSWVVRACRNAKQQLSSSDNHKRIAGTIGDDEAEFRSTMRRLQKMNEVNSLHELHHQDIDNGPCRSISNFDWQ